MPDVELVRRGSCVDRFGVEPGASLFGILLSRGIPPASALVLADGEPVSVFASVVEGASYTVRIPEGYDIQQHRRSFDQDPPADAVYTSRRLSFGEEGDIDQVVDHHDAAGLVAAVERTIHDTVTHYDLLSSGESVLVGLSGEGDSAAMLLALSALRSELDIQLEAVTLAEPRGAEPAAHEHATELAAELGVPHRTVGLETIQDLYRLERPVREVFSDIEASDYRTQQITVLESVHRRLFEHVAAETGAEHVCLGSHATEFVAGILNAFLTGTERRRGGIPEHRTGPVSYVYPVALLDKVQLSLYHYVRTGDFPPASAQNMWDAMPAEQSFIYHLADTLRSYWPGVEHWLIESHRSRSDDSPTFGRCDHCEKYVPQTAPARCLACRAFAAVDAL